MITLSTKLIFCNWRWCVNTVSRHSCYSHEINLWLLNKLIFITSKKSSLLWWWRGPSIPKIAALEIKISNFPPLIFSVDGLRQRGVQRAAETSGRNLRVMDVLSVGLERTEGLFSARRMEEPMLDIADTNCTGLVCHFIWLNVFTYTFNRFTPSVHMCFLFKTFLMNFWFTFQ